MDSDDTKSTNFASTNSNSEETTYPNIDTTQQPGSSTFNTNDLTNIQNIGGSNEQSSQFVSNTLQSTNNNIPESSTISSSENGYESSTNKYTSEITSSNIGTSETYSSSEIPSDSNLRKYLIYL